MSGGVAEQALAVAAEHVRERLAAHRAREVDIFLQAAAVTADVDAPRRRGASRDRQGCAEWFHAARQGAFCFEPRFEKAEMRREAAKPRAAVCFTAPSAVDVDAKRGRAPRCKPRADPKHPAAIGQEIARVLRREIVEHRLDLA
jgi:hypothetical protein